MQVRMLVGLLGEYYVAFKFNVLGGTVDRIDHSGVDLVVYAKKNWGVSVKTRDISRRVNNSIVLSYNDVALLYLESKKRSLVPAYAFVLLGRDKNCLLICEQTVIFTHLCKKAVRIGGVHNYMAKYAGNPDAGKLSINVSQNQRDSVWAKLRGLPGVLLVEL